MGRHQHSRGQAVAQAVLGPVPVEEVWLRATAPTTVAAARRLCTRGRPLNLQLQLQRQQPLAREQQRPMPSLRLVVMRQRSPLMRVRLVRRCKPMPASHTCSKCSRSGRRAGHRARRLGLLKV